jgi:hypothetical protein
LAVSVLQWPRLEPPRLQRRPVIRRAGPRTAAHQVALTASVETSSALPVTANKRVSAAELAEEELLLLLDVF